METNEVVDRLTALCEASPESNPKQLVEETLLGLYDKSQYEGSDPEMLTRAVEASAILLALSMGDDE